MDKLTNVMLWDIDYFQRSERTKCCFEDVVSNPVDLIEKYLVCSICYGLPRILWIGLECGHVLCDTCYSTASYKERDFRCPVCREKVIWRGHSSYKSVDITQQRLYSEFTEVKCGNACGYTGPVTRMFEHEKVECPNRYILCPFRKCPFLGPAHLVNGEHKKECKYALQVCPLCLTPQPLQGPHNCLNESIMERERMFSIFFPLKLILHI